MDEKEQLIQRVFEKHEATLQKRLLDIHNKMKSQVNTNDLNFIQLLKVELLLEELLGKDKKPEKTGFLRKIFK